MNRAQRLIEGTPILAWHRARLVSPLYRRAFASFCHGNVIVTSAVLRGVDRKFTGSKCAFYAGAWLGGEPGVGPIEIGDDNDFGHRAHLHGGAPLTVGSNCVFADDVDVATTDHLRKDRSRSTGTAPVLVGDRVFLGQRVTVLGGVTIGDGTIVGAHAVVTKDVPPDTVVACVPTREIRPKL